MKNSSDHKTCWHDAEMEEVEFVDPELLAKEYENTDAVYLFLKESSKIPRLTPEQEVEAARMVADGLKAQATLKEMNAAGVPDEELRKELEQVVKAGKRAKDDLVRANVWLSIFFASRYGRDKLFLDLVQEGCLALIKATETFDFTKGYRFSTYAAKGLKQRIKRYGQEQQSLIRFPGHILSLGSKIRRAEADLERDLGRLPTAHEIAEEAGLPLKDVEKLIPVMKHSVISLDAPVTEDQDMTLGSFIVDDMADPAGEAIKLLTRQNIEQVLNMLEEKEAQVIRLRYGFEDSKCYSVTAVHKRLKMSVHEVRKHETIALIKLRQVYAKYLTDAS